MCCGYASLSRRLHALWLTELLEPNKWEEYHRNSCDCHMPEWLSASWRTLCCHLQLTGTLGAQPTSLWRLAPQPPDTTSFPHYCVLCFPSTVACSRLSLPANVITNTSSNAPGITVNFSCKNGNIVGNSAISCLRNGSWSGSVPYCTSGNSFPSCFTFTAKSLVPVFQTS